MNLLFKCHWNESLNQSFKLIFFFFFLNGSFFLSRQFELIHRNESNVTTAKLCLRLKFKPEYNSVYLCLNAIIINLFIIALCTVTSSMSWTGHWDQPGLRQVWLHNADCTACVCVTLYSSLHCISASELLFAFYIYMIFNQNKLLF